jgi:hypothetical protein
MHRSLVVGLLGVLALLGGSGAVAAAEEMSWLRIGEDQRSFVLASSGRPWVPWGFNYDHDHQGRLLEDYWESEWPTVEQDFQEMKRLGANVVRIHLQVGKLMEQPDVPNPKALARLAKLVQLAEQTGLYLDLTGLGCYHRRDIPGWYDKLSEEDRWKAQACFWEAVARQCASSPAIFCYDLMNEPVVPGGPQKPGDWLPGPALGGKQFVQFITLDPKGRSRAKIAQAWIHTLVEAIRKQDRRHWITVGLLPGTADRADAWSGFDPKGLTGDLDFIAVHIYPETGQLEQAWKTLAKFAVGKPVVIEEIFPLKCSIEELGPFVDLSRKYAAGWIGFYWGKTPDELRKSDSLAEAITLKWLDWFEKASPSVQSGGPLAAPGQERPFAIRVVDAETGRSVPLVELRTTNEVRHYTDSHGLVAFQEPGLMNQKVFFHVRSHGYEHPADGFGQRGVALDVTPGGSATLKIKRINLAERLYRITGGGIYRDSLLLQEQVPLRQPVLDAQVFGQDSVQPAIYQGKIYWFWGDTSRASYPLGNFRTSGAVSDLPGHGGLDPSVGVDLTYWTGADGFCKAMCPFEPKQGMMWIDGLLVVPDVTGRQRLVTHFSRMKSLGEIFEHGLAVFNDEKQEFERLATFQKDQRWQCPHGQPFPYRDADTDYFYLGLAFPNVRVKADWKSLSDPTAYEAWSCLAEGSTSDLKNAKVQRDADGRLVYRWTRNAPPVAAPEEKQLLAAKQIRPEEARFQPVDVETGRIVQMHGGSVRWNAWRQRWVLIAVEIGGASMLGEVWYAESRQPTGPWRRARKIVTHDRYSFYNPVHHEFFDQAEGRTIYFEGTYTATFSGNLDPTPRYDYNQIMYRLDLADPRLKAAWEE